MKGAEKFGKICLFLPPMRGSRPGTLLSSRRWELQFQDIVIEIVHTNTIVRHTSWEVQFTKVIGVVYYPLIALGKCQYNGTTGSSTKVIFSPCPLFIVNL